MQLVHQISRLETRSVNSLERRAVLEVLAANRPPADPVQIEIVLNARCPMSFAHDIQAAFS